MEKELPESMWGMGRMDIKAMQQIIKDGKLDIRYYLENAHERLNAHVSAIQALNSRVSALTELTERIENIIEPHGHTVGIEGEPGHEHMFCGAPEFEGMPVDRDVRHPMSEQPKSDKDANYVHVVPGSFRGCPNCGAVCASDIRTDCIANRFRHWSAIPPDPVPADEKPSIEAWLRVKVLEPGDYRALVGIESGGKVPYYARARIEDLITDLVSAEEMEKALRARSALEDVIARLATDVVKREDADETLRMMMAAKDKVISEQGKEITRLATVAGAIEVLKGHGAEVNALLGKATLIIVPAKKEGE